MDPNLRRSALLVCKTNKNWDWKGTTTREEGEKKGWDESPKLTAVQEPSSSYIWLEGYAIFVALKPRDDLASSALHANLGLSNGMSWSSSAWVHLLKIFALIFSLLSRDCSANISLEMVFWEEKREKNPPPTPPDPNTAYPSGFVAKKGFLCSLSGDILKCSNWNWPLANCFLLTPSKRYR